MNGKLGSMRKKLMNKRIGIFLFLFVAVQTFFFLEKRHIVNLPLPLVKTVEIIVFLITTLLVISVILRFTSNRLYKAFEGEVEIEQRIFLSKMYSFFLYLIGFGLLLWKLGVSAGNITIFLGLITTGVAFAVRDVLMSIFAWLIVLTKKPFKMYDNVKIGDESGEVSRIGTFYITLKTCKDSKNVVRIPNKILLEKPIANYGKKRKLITVKVPLEEVPKDIAKRISKLKMSLNEYATEKENVHVKIDSEGINWFIYISLTAEAFDEEIYNKVMMVAIDICRDIIKKKGKIPK